MAYFRTKEEAIKLMTSFSKCVLEKYDFLNYVSIRICFQNNCVMVTYYTDYAPKNFDTVHFLGWVEYAPKHIQHFKKLLKCKGVTPKMIDNFNEFIKNHHAQ